VEPVSSHTHADPVASFNRLTSSALSPFVDNPRSLSASRSCVTVSDSMGLDGVYGTSVMPTSLAGLAGVTVLTATGGARLGDAGASMSTSSVAGAACFIGVSAGEASTGEAGSGVGAFARAGGAGGGGAAASVLRGGGAAGATNVGGGGGGGRASPFDSTPPAASSSTRLPASELKNTATASRSYIS
jgi:hypothetical protein